MTAYRKKPVVVHAMQFTGTNRDEIAAFVGDGYDIDADGGFVIRTLEGNMTANPGDYVIKGVQGEFYPCKEDIFHATYEGVPT